jgi:hypothetical protein
VEKMLLIMVTKSMDIHVLPKLGGATTISTSFDLWISRGRIDTFSLVINYFSEAWEHVHATIGLFEVNETTGSCMAQQLQSLLEKFGLIHQVLAFVKNEGSNLASMATTLCSIVDCELLYLPRFMKALLLVMCCPKHVNILQMMTKFLWC